MSARLTSGRPRVRAPLLPFFYGFHPFLNGAVWLELSSYNYTVKIFIPCSVYHISVRPLQLHAGLKFRDVFSLSFYWQVNYTMVLREIKQEFAKKDVDICAKDDIIKKRRWQK